MSIATATKDTMIKTNSQFQSSDSDMTHLAVARDVLLNEAAALHAMIDSLGQPFCNVINLIQKIRGRVIVTGMGKSGHVARKIASTLASTGQPALFVHPAEASHGDMGMITQDDLVLALSNSGETAELANVIDYTQRFSIPLVAMTRREESTLNRLATISLVLPDQREACPMGLAPTTSTTMMLALGDAIAVALLNSRGFSPADFKVYHPGGSLGGRLHRVKERMHQGTNIPLVTAMSSMGDVILMISEKGFGCVGVLNDQNALMGVITDGDLRRHMGDTLLTLTAQEVMTTNPLTITSDMLMTEALALMNNKRITSLFVVDHNEINGHPIMGAPVGIIHVHDFLRTGVV